MIADPREVLFATGVLRAHGLSPDYSRVIAERVLVPGADLGVADSVWLEIVRKSQRLFATGSRPTRARSAQ